MTSSGNNQKDRRMTKRGVAFTETSSDTDRSIKSEVMKHLPKITTASGQTRYMHKKVNPPWYKRYAMVLPDDERRYFQPMIEFANDKIGKQLIPLTEKASPTDNTNKVEQLIKMIEESRQRKIQMAMDIAHGKIPTKSKRNQMHKNSDVARELQFGSMLKRAVAETKGSQESDILFQGFLAHFRKLSPSSKWNLIRSNRIVKMKLSAMYKEARKKAIIHQWTSAFSKIIAVLKFHSALANIARTTGEIFGKFNAAIEETLKEHIGNGALYFDSSVYSRSLTGQKEVSDDVILTLRSLRNARSEPELNEVIKTLKVFRAFNHFPHYFQNIIAQIGQYMKIPPDKVIIREGQPPCNFYFVISGRMMAVKLKGSPVVGEPSHFQFLKYFERGDSFGSEGMYDCPVRQHSVMSVTHCEILSVAMDDFLEMSVIPGPDDDLPPHITFLSQLELMKYFPIHKLLDDCSNGNIILFYFEPGKVITKKSAESDYMFMVKSGWCRILAKIKFSRNHKHSHSSTTVEVSDAAEKLPSTMEEYIEGRYFVPPGRASEGGVKGAALPRKSIMGAELPGVAAPHAESQRRKSVYVANLTNARRKSVATQGMKRSRANSIYNRYSTVTSQRGQVMTKPIIRKDSIKEKLVSGAEVNSMFKNLTPPSAEAGGSRQGRTPRSKAASRSDSKNRTNNKDDQQPKRSPGLSQNRSKILESQVPLRSRTSRCNIQTNQTNSNDQKPKIPLCTSRNRSLSQNHRTSNHNSCSSRLEQSKLPRLAKSDNLNVRDRDFTSDTVRNNRPSLKPDAKLHGNANKSNSHIYSQRNTSANHTATSSAIQSSSHSSSDKSSPNSSAKNLKLSSHPSPLSTSAKSSGSSQYSQPNVKKHGGNSEMELFLYKQISDKEANFVEREISLTPTKKGSKVARETRRQSIAVVGGRSGMNVDQSISFAGQGRSGSVSEQAWGPGSTAASHARRGTSFSMEYAAKLEKLVTTPSMHKSNILREMFWVQIKKLRDLDWFGVEDLELGDVKGEVCDVAIVSDGCEMVMVNKKWFMANMNPKLAAYLRQRSCLIPTERIIKTKLFKDMQWRHFRRLIGRDHARRLDNTRISFA